MKVRSVWLALAVLGPLLAGCGHRRLLAAIEPTLDAHPAPPDADVGAWVLRARVGEDRGDLDEADRAWQWAVRFGADDPWTWTGRGGFLERAGRADDALSAYREALARDPGLARAHLGIGRILVTRGDDPDGAPELQAAADAGLPEALHLLARLRLRAGDEAGALAVYEAWAKRPTTVVGEHLDRGRLALAVGRPAAAVDDLVAALRGGQGGPQTAGILARTARGVCRIGPVWRWAVETRLGDREDPAWRSVAVTIALSARDPDLLEQAIGPGEGLDLLLAERLDLLVAAGRTDAALGVLDEAAAARPEDASLRLRRAAVLARATRSQQALAILAQVPPDSRYGGAAALQAAEIHLALGDPQAALAVLDAASSSGWSLTRVRARALAAAGQLQQAEDVLQHGSAPPAERWRQVGHLREAAGDDTGALEAYAASGDDPRALAERARLLERTGNRGGAEAVWKRLVTVDPSDSAAWVGLARVSGDPGPALHRALQADPCDVPARLALAATEPPCAATAPLERAREAAPRDPRVLDALASAYHACGVARQTSGQEVQGALEGLRDVEWTWQVVGDDAAVARVHALLAGLEGS